MQRKHVFDAEEYEYEMIFINDGSKDKTQEALESVFNLHEACVVVETFSRNFGKEAAIYAGFQKATGDFITVIDADLQQRPETVARMVKILQDNEEFDCVAKISGEASGRKKLVSKLKDMFYKIINRTSEIEFFPGASDFRTFRRPVVDAVLSLPEYHRFSKGIFSWVGFNTCYIPYTAEKRNAGETKWSINKLFRYAVEGFISYTTFPLKIATGLGFIYFFMCNHLFICCCDTKIMHRESGSGIPDNCCSDIIAWRNTTYDPWNYWRISCKNVYTGEAQTNLYREEIVGL